MRIEGEDKMGKATLVIMAAGIGSRFGGGIKQLEPVGPSGEIIMDYSIYDALEAGFDKVIFVIRRDLEREFKERIGRRIEKVADVDYVFQEVDDIPLAYQSRFADRTKPWGTGQAILCCKEKVNTPFLVINADDYYGKEAYGKALQYLTTTLKTDKIRICMVSFVLKNTLSENGGVTRGVCHVGEDELLTDITETHNIEKRKGQPVICNGRTEIPLDGELPVSMNMWGFTPDFFPMLESGFIDFLNTIPEDDREAEYLLPTIIGNLLAEKRLEVRVLKSYDQWFGVTYREDKEAVVNAVRALVEEGVYPVGLFAK